MGTLFAIAVSIIIAGVLWFHVVRPILEDFGVIRVNSSEPVMSRPLAAALPDQPDRPADRLSVSAAIEKLPRLQLDKTREALIDELLTLGWTMTDLRREGILRGDNTKISAEVEAARQRLGIESGESRTPIANRPTAAQFASDKVP
jgi:hypothetical protein